MSCSIDSSCETQVLVDPRRTSQLGGCFVRLFAQRGARYSSAARRTPLEYSSSLRAAGCCQKLYASLSSRARRTTCDFAATGANRMSKANALFRSGARLGAPQRLSPAVLLRSPSVECIDTCNSLAEDERMDVVRPLVRVDTLEVRHVTHRTVFGENSHGA